MQQKYLMHFIMPIIISPVLHIQLSLTCRCTNESTSLHINTFAASYLNIQGLNNSFLKSPASTLVDLTFQSRTLRSFSLNQLRNLSL